MAQSSKIYFQVSLKDLNLNFDSDFDHEPNGSEDMAIRFPFQCRFQLQIKYPLIFILISRGNENYLNFSKSYLVFKFYFDFNHKLNIYRRI